MVLQIVFYAMPIIYPITQVANVKVFGIEAQRIMMLNPVAQTIQDVRHNLIAPDTVPTTWSIEGNLLISLIPIIITIIVLIIGVWYFRKNSKKFAEIM